MLLLLELFVNVGRDVIDSCVDKVIITDLLLLVAIMLQLAAFFVDHECSTLHDFIRLLPLDTHDRDERPHQLKLLECGLGFLFAIVLKVLLLIFVGFLRLLLLRLVEGHNLLEWERAADQVSKAEEVLWIVLHELFAMSE